MAAAPEQAGVPYSDGQVRSATGKLTRRLAKFAAMTLEQPIEPANVEPFMQRKGTLHDEIEALRHQLDALKAERKATAHHITVEELPEEARARQLSGHSKHLLDTIKLIAYRAETAMANSLRERLKRPDEARRLLCALYTTEADLLPDPDAGTLTVRRHHGANAATNQVIEKPCEELNETETVFPRTKPKAGDETGVDENVPEIRSSEGDTGELGFGVRVRSLVDAIEQGAAVEADRTALRNLLARRH